MVNSPKSRKRKLKTPPQPPRATRAKTIEVEEPDGFGSMVEQFLFGSGSGGSIADHPSSSSDAPREEYVPMGILSPTPISLPPVSPNDFTSTPLAPSTSEGGLSIHDYGGWEETATGTVAYPFLESSFIDPNNNSNLRFNNNNNGGLSNSNSNSSSNSNLEPFVYPEPISYSLPPIFKTPLPPLYYRPRFHKPN